MATKKKTTTEDEKPIDKGKLDPPKPPPVPSVSIGRTEGKDGHEIVLHRLEAVQDSLRALIPNILHLEAAAQRAVINSEETFNKGSTFISACDKQWEQIEAYRKAIKNPLDDYIKLVQATFVPLQKRLEIAKEKVGKQMKAFFIAEEARKKAEADAQRKRQEEAAQKIAEEHEKAGRADVAQAVLDAAISAPAPARQVTLGAEANAYGERTAPRKTWKGEIANEKEMLQAIIDGKLPGGILAWFEPKQSQLNAYAKLVNAEGTVNGIKCFQDVNLQQRGG